MVVIKKVRKVEMVLPTSSMNIEETLTYMVSKTLCNKFETKELKMMLSKVKKMK